MHPELVRRFHDRIRDEAGHRYGLSPSDLTELDAFENFVYEAVNQDGVDLILRVSHSALDLHQLARVRDQARVRRPERLVDDVLRLLQEVAGAPPKCRDGGIEIAKARKDHALQQRAVSAQLGQDLEPRHVGEPAIDQGDVRPVRSSRR